MHEGMLSLDEITLFVQSLLGGKYAEQVYTHLALLRRTFGSVAVGDMHAARDASHTLFEIAWTCGFSAAAWVFYDYYEHLSRALLFCQ